MVTPLKPLPFDELRHMLPSAAQREFPADPAVMIEIINGVIDEHHSATDLPRPESYPPSEKGALPEQPSDDSKSGDRTEEPALFSTLTASPTLWDATVVLVLTITMFGGPSRSAEIDRAIEKVDQHLNA